LEKSNKATVVQAPRITMFNNQRAHIFVLQNTAYIADYSPALAAGAGALDPIIGLLQTGVVLDVRPVVSNDRRYVTLELRPTLAELQTLRQVRLQTVDSDQGRIDLNVQLPHILLQRAEATVQVPDQGAVLLTGFRDIFYRDVKSEIPFLGKIPIIGFLFQRQGKSNEQRHLMIVVSPEIIDMSERENQAF
jgi:MSHA biogenesis protein MshL